MTSHSGTIVRLGDGAVAVRPRADRPGFGQMVFRTVLIVGVNVGTLWVMSKIFAQFTIADTTALIIGGVVLGLINGVIWPALSAIITPISVLTLGIGAVAINALLTAGALELVPGIEVPSIWYGLGIGLGVSVISGIAAAIFAVNDDAWTDQEMIRRVNRHKDVAKESDHPGVVFIQIDGLSRPVLESALSGGRVPTLYRWLGDGTHQLFSWHTEWSSQTGVSQCGILHGSVEDMPAFRWYEKDNERLMVSNHPDSAAEIERRHSDGNGLLAHNGSSYGNLFTGDAQRAAMTMSGVTTVREGRIGTGYFGYFARPTQAIRTGSAAVVDIVAEWIAATKQIRRGVQPRVHRGFIYAFLRAFTTTVSRDVCVAGILRDMAEGRAVIYADLLGYDEVAHHSGPERDDTLKVLQNVDEQIARIERAAQWCPREYRLVVLSDHGQTQGPCFGDQYGQTIMEVVGDLINEKTATDPASLDGKTESSAWFRPSSKKIPEGMDKEPTVLGSGNLSLVYLPGPPRRLTRSEIDERHPKLIDGLVEHPGVGFVLVAIDEEASVALGADGEHWFPSGKIVGDDPLAPFGPFAAEKVEKVTNYPHVADLMINSSYDPIRDEVMAFELQVGSHGGLGGDQMYPFVLAPADMQVEGEIVGPAELHRVLKQYLVDVGQPVTVSDRVPHPKARASS